MPLTHVDKLNELLRKWEEYQLLGKSISLERFCVDCPELLEELRTRLGELNGPGSVASSDTTVQESHPQNDTETPREDASHFPGHEILALLGQGGMGLVFKAREIALDRVVALKTLRPRLPSGAMPDVARFLREARAQGQLQHPNVVQIYTIAESASLPFITMEYVPGGSLSDRLNGKPMPPREAAGLVATLARALQISHDKNILHRDLKPSNILLTPSGTPKVADFGLAKQVESDIDLTCSGQPIGTPSYMSPEQARGQKDVGPAADVYGLGAILYECLIGCPPFKAATPAETLSDVLTKPPTPPRTMQRNIDRVLDAVCLKCLEKRPEDRYPSALALAEDLDCWREGKPTKVRPLSLVRRGIRTVTHHLALTVWILLLVIVGLSFVPWKVPTDPTKPDPEAVTRQYRLDLQEGRPVTLIGETGAPRWTRTLIGEPLAPFTGDSGKEFSLGAKDERVVQLVASPGIERLLFRAEVSHDEAAAIGEAGIFFGMQSFSTTEGKAHLVCTWTFNDRAPPANVVRYPTMTFRMIHDLDPPKDEITRRRSKLGGGFGKTAAFKPIGPVVGNRKWRTLAVEIAPDKISAYWDGRLSHTLDAPVIRDRLRGLFSDIPDLRDQEPVFRTDAPLGIFLLDGAATFKNVVVEPR